MSPEVGRWLLAYPYANGISQLAIDAHRLKYVDFPRALAVAIATNLRHEAAGDGTLIGDPQDHCQIAQTAVELRRRCRLRLEEGAVLLSGAFTPNAAISQGHRFATLYVHTEVPETILAAAPGREVRTVVASDLFTARPYVISAVRRHPRGCSFDFDVPLVPCAEWVGA